MVHDGGRCDGGDGALHCFDDLGDSGDDGGHHSGDYDVHWHDHSGGDGVHVRSGGGCAQYCQHH